MYTERKVPRTTRKPRVSNAPLRAPATPVARPLHERFWREPKYVVALFALLVLLFYAEPLLSENASIQWDAVDVHYSSQKYLSDSVHQGKLPFWTPYIYSGMPFLADPQVGAWYPLNWPFFLADITPRSVEWELALHAFLACCGAWLLAAELLEGSPLAVLAGIFYGLSGFFAAHSSHVGMFQAAALLPWLLWAFVRAVHGPMAKFGALAAATGGAIVLAGHFQTALYSFFALALLVAVRCLLRDPAWLRRAPFLLAGVAAGAFALSAIATLPGLELAAQSIRASANFSTQTNSALTAGALLTLILPDYYGAVRGDYRGPADITQFYFYGGILLPILAAIGCRDRKSRWTALALLLPAVWYASGPRGGLYLLIARLPGFRSLRAPVHIWFVAALAISLLACAGARFLQEKWPRPWLLPVLLLIAFSDSWYWNMDQNQLAYARRPFEEIYGAAAGRFEAATSSLRQSGLHRLFAPNDSNAFGPMNNALNVHTEVTYGYNPLELSAYERYIGAAQSNPKLLNGLSVTEKLDLHNGDIVPNPDALPRVTAPQKLLVLTHSESGLATLDPATSAIVERAAPGGDGRARAEIVGYGPDEYRIRYRAASPTLIRIATPFYPGWRAEANGAALEVLRVDSALSGVIAPVGVGEIRFWFQSDWFGAGAALSAATLLALAIWAAWPKIRSRGAA